MAFEEININDSLRLIQLQPEQADRIFELTDSNREYLGRFLPWVSYVHTIDDSRRYIEDSLLSREHGVAYTYGIECDGRVVGDISIRNLLEGDPEIGYWMSEDYSGRGITTLTVRALTDFAIKHFGLEKIIIRVEPLNIASNKVAEKAGYKLIGQVDDAEYSRLNIWVFAS